MELRKSRRLWLLRSESGQAIVIAAVGMTVIMGFLGLAVDVGHMRYMKRNLQMAADAAALAAALEIQACGGTTNCSAMQAAAEDALTENGFASATLVTNCAATAVSGLKLMMNNGPCAMGSADPNYGKQNYVEVLVSQPQTTIFARILGWNNVPLAARAEAARAGGANCMFALDPSGSGAITVSVLASLTSSCGMVDESTSSSALTCSLFASISALQIAVAGGVQNFLCSLSPTPKTYVTSAMADPLANLATPTVPACGTSTKTPYSGAAQALTITGTAVLYPTYAYCGGITIAAGAKVTFEPGVYVLTSINKGVTKSPGGLTIDAGTAVSGTGVTFYNYGPSGGITFSFTSFGGTGVSLIAPTTGTYSGILFFQDASDSAAATVIGTSSWNTVLEGTYYFPSAKVTFAFSGAVNYNILDAYDIEFAALTFGSTKVTASGFASNYTSLANGSPAAGNGAALVQ